jgi:hypothetical protein
LGNAASSTDFLGTTNNVDLVLKRNNMQVMRFMSNGGSGGVVFGSGSSAYGSGSISSGGSGTITGSNSIGLGLGSYYLVSGSNSIAIGGNYGGVSGSGSVAIGCNNGMLSGSGSLAIGTSGTFSGNYSLGVGSVVAGNLSLGVGAVRVVGNNSFAVGYSTLAQAYTSTVIGTYNDTTYAYSPSVPAQSDRLFQIGNGVAQLLSNAVTVLRNGNFSIGSNYAPTEKLEVGGRIKAEKLQVSLSTTPISTADTQGNIGDIARDDYYIYVKTSTGWKRAALSTF